ncbi:uncharacterized protein LOC127255855 [Andrographis paniculata]|uniref:uncharacterized protein LOC127255855 n=1 Tax=Andrographis paniculata TaxID=175694 RepID=UPI0021E8FA30|nr:uncharacterized protein LOC127255855 [Andrographis paniculata]
MSVNYSIWPVVLVIYNLPPWLCMKQPSFLISTIIDGPKGPGDRIDVFLQPLVAELKELWDIGLRTFDAVSQEYFQMRAALLWTISDFPDYAMLSGWPTRGGNACPNCGVRTHSTYLKNGHKFCYCGHRRFLPDGHRMRRDRHSFDGTMNFEPSVTRITVAELHDQLRDVPTAYRKEDLVAQQAAQQSRKQRRREQRQSSTWKKKKNIFLELPYWADHDIRHNLDLMHIEKNVCENILHTLLGTKGKTKDNLSTRKDLQLMNIRSSLHPVSKPNVRRYIMHYPTHRFVLLALQLHDFVREEAMLGGPVQYRWMYPIERYLGTLKRYVRNRANPNGSIAHGYLVEECMTFCSRYLGDLETKENRVVRHDDLGSIRGRGLFGSRCNLDFITLQQIHGYILGNVEVIGPLRSVHLESIKRMRPNASPREVQQIHIKQFPGWFQTYVEDPTHNVDGTITANIKTLAQGPYTHATRFTSCIVSGIRFRVKSRDEGKKTQCAGVMVNVETISYASARDLNPRAGSVAYYGLVTDIIEVEYSNEIRFLLFKCDWADPEKGVKDDEYKYKMMIISGQGLTLTMVAYPDERLIIG